MHRKQWNKRGAIVTVSMLLWGGSTFVYANPNDQGTGREGFAVTNEVVSNTKEENFGIADVATNLNIREGAGTGYEIIGKLPKNALCYLESTKDGWSYITSGEVEGYVSTSYLLIGDAANDFVTAAGLDNMVLAHWENGYDSDSSVPNTEEKADFASISGIKELVGPSSHDISADQAEENADEKVPASIDGELTGPLGTTGSMTSTKEADQTGPVAPTEETDAAGPVAPAEETDAAGLAAPAEEADVIGPETPTEEADATGPVTPTEEDSTGPVTPTEEDSTGPVTPTGEDPTGPIAPTEETDPTGPLGPAEEADATGPVTPTEEDAAGPIAPTEETDPTGPLGPTEETEPTDTGLPTDEGSSAQSEETAAAAVSDLRTQMVSFAEQFLGNPYVWGGTSLTEGADCSGFVQSIYANFGIPLPRVSADQSQTGTRITIEEALPGDLIFYAKDGVVYHVVMYIGDGKVIHASSKKTGIKISNIYYKNAVWAVRLLDE